MGRAETDWYGSVSLAILFGIGTPYSRLTPREGTYVLLGSLSCYAVLITHCNCKLSQPTTFMLVVKVSLDLSRFILFFRESLVFTLIRLGLDVIHLIDLKKK